MATAKRIIVRIDARVGWKVGKCKEGHWLAVCDALKLTLQAETWANLMEDMALTLDAMLKDLLSTNDLNRFMQEHGWKMVGSIPKHKRQEDISFDIPFLPSFTERLAPSGSERRVH